MQKKEVQCLFSAKKSDFIFLSHSTLTLSFGSILGAFLDVKLKYVFNIFNKDKHLFLEFRRSNTGKSPNCLKFDVIVIIIWFDQLT